MVIDELFVGIEERLKCCIVVIIWVAFYMYMLCQNARQGLGHESLNSPALSHRSRIRNAVNELLRSSSPSSSETAQPSPLEQQPESPTFVRVLYENMVDDDSEEYMEEAVRRNLVRRQETLRHKYGWNRHHSGVFINGMRLTDYDSE